MPAEAEEAKMPEAKRKPDAKMEMKKAKCKDGEGDERRLYALERKRVHSTAYVAAIKASIAAGKSEVAIVNFSMRNYVSYGLRECAP